MKKKPLTPQEQLNNLCDALSEDALKDSPPEMSKEEVERIRQELKDAATGSHVANMERKLAKDKLRQKNKWRN